MNPMRELQRHLQTHFTPGRTDPVMAFLALRVGGPLVVHMAGFAPGVLVAQMGEFELLAVGLTAAVCGAIKSGLFRHARTGRGMRI